MVSSSDCKTKYSANGSLLMLSSALMYTLFSVLIKAIGPDLRVWDIAFYRFFGGTLLLLGIFARGKNLFRGNNIRLLIIRGFASVLAFLTFVAAIRLLSLSTAMFFQYSAPGFAALFAFLLYGEKMTLNGLICIIVMLLGLTILFNFKLEGGLLGQVMGISSGAFAGIAVTFVKKLRQNNNTVTIYLYFSIVGLLWSVIFLIFSNKGATNSRAKIHPKGSN